VYLFIPKLFILEIWPFALEGSFCFTVW